MIALVFAVMVIASASLVAMGIMGLLGRLPPNALVGIRLPYTMSSPERWYTTHRYAAAPPMLVLGGVATTSVSLAFFPFRRRGPPL
ncbi:MAG: SdpI family protein [Dehalococcoidia bacterium]|nr:SdpI family protein [Dehalococcoidia bacterium]